jgi:hypothetical protein
VITLPPLERACLRSFSTVIGIFSGACVAMLSTLLGLSNPIILGALVAICLALPGLLMPGVARFLYRAWNKMALEFARCARTMVMGICFYVILVAVGRTGSSINLKAMGSEKSMWLTRGTTPVNSYSEQHTMVISDSRKRNWILSFMSWAGRTGNFWRVSLIPFLILLVSLDCSTEETVPTDIYTLY